MATSTDVVALDRPKGSFYVDSSGLANYQIKLDLPPGIGVGNTPDLALCYVSGQGNGVTGLQWSLSGMSAIQRAPKSLATDGVISPVTYNADGTRFALDGTPLILSSGPGAVYTTEINLGKTITTTGNGLEQGFVVIDHDGRTWEYGTSTDSRSLSLDSQHIREWHLKYNYDFYGNCMTYNYTNTPRILNGGPVGTDDTGITYLDSILYSSNRRDNAQAIANRSVNFFYTARPDPVVVCGAGDILKMAHILCRIQTSIQIGSASFQARAYNLTYETSSASGASRIVKIQEEGADGSTLKPTNIEYTASGPSNTWFQQLTHPVDLLGTRAADVQALLPLDITGKGLSDLCLISIDQASNLSTKCCLAQSDRIDANGNNIVNWAPSINDDGQGTLPLIANSSKPAYIPTDLSGDGRSDLVMAFDSGSGLKFSLSRCTGTGFSPYIIYDTPYDWQNGDSFFPMDCTGNGRIDVVQVTTVSGMITLRAYTSTPTSDGNYTLGNIIEFETGEDASDTLQWFPADVNGNGLQDLVRVWHDHDENGLCDLWATTYTSNSLSSDSFSFANSATSPLGRYTPEAFKRLAVLACDVNADGIQDIVACEVKQVCGSDCQLTFNFGVFLCDGTSDFKPYSTQTLSHVISGQTSPVTDGSFEFVSVDGTSMPSIVYRFQDYLGNQTAMIARGNYSAQISPFSKYTIFNQSSRTTIKHASMVAADVNGTGKSGWFAWSSDGGSLTSVIPIYNTQPLCDVLSSVTDPLGLCTVPTYRPMSQSNVYQSNPSTGSTASQIVPIFGGTQYVVSQYSETNLPSLNALKISQTTFRFYQGARTDLSGHGWQGFKKVYTLTNQQKTLLVETYAQDYPLTMYKTEEDIYGYSTASPAVFPVLDSSKQLRSNLTEFESQKLPVAGGSTYFTNKVLEQVITYDGGTATSKTGAQTSYNNSGLPIMTNTFVGDPSNPNSKTFQQGTQTVYISIGLRQTAVSVTKTSTIESNLNDMTRFIDGDIDWSSYTYDQGTYGLQQKTDWSSYHNANLTSTFESNIYGNQTSATSPTGLTTMTTYDNNFQTFSIQVTQSGSGLAQPLTRSYAYDARFGVPVANTQYNGLVSYSTLDAFGREDASMITAPLSPSGQNTNQVQSFILGPADLLNKLDTQALTRVTQTTYNTTADAATTRVWLSKSVVAFTTQDSTSTASASTDYTDGSGRPQRSVSQQGSYPAYWTYRDFDSNGNAVSESFPIGATSNSVIQCLDFPVPPDQCKTTTYDSLQRPIGQLGPRPTPNEPQLMTTTTFSDGGTTLTSVQSALQKGNTVPDSPPLSSMVLKYKIIAGQAQLASQTDELGKQTTFNYDPAGNMTLTTDPGGKKDSSTYDLQGILRSTDNDYQNPTQQLSGAMTYTYDVGNRPISETNAEGQITTYQYDALSRRIQRHGTDGRTITYTYNGNQNGMGNVTLATVSKPNLSESESTYSFTYDERGLPVSSSVTVNFNGPATYTTQYEYDLQGQMLSKTLPDQSKVQTTYSGTQAATSTIASDSSQSPTWKLAANFVAYDPLGRCSSWGLTGSGSIAGSFTGASQFGLTGCPIARSLNYGASSGTALVNEAYSTDALGRMVQCNELVAQSTHNYSYLGKRLAASTSNNTSANYAYDDSGNLLGKGGLQFSYSNGRASGTSSAGEVFTVNYSASGKMASRMYNGQSFAFQYDGFGKTSAVSNGQTSQTNYLYSDFLGRSLAQVMPDNSIKIRVSPDFSVTTQSDGTQITERFLYGPDSILAKITSTRTQQTTDSLGVFFTNHKGSISHIFNASGQLQRQLTYDDFGMLTSTPNTQADLTASYESLYTSLDTGLVSFGARDYDPVLGRFTTPDNQWSSDPLTDCDVTNRYAFENNDPIHHVDPTGHWTAWAIAAMVVGTIVAVVAGAATAGMAFGLIGALAGTSTAIMQSVIAGAFLGAGLSAASYALSNPDQSASNFAKGIAADVAIGFAIGAITGAIGGYFHSARIGAMAEDAAMSRYAARAPGGGAMFGASLSLQHLVTGPAVSDALEAADPTNPPPAAGKSSGGGGGSVSDGGFPGFSGGSRNFPSSNARDPALGRAGVSRSYSLQLPVGPVPVGASSGGSFDWMTLAADAVNATSGALQMGDIPSATTGNVS